MNRRTCGFASPERGANREAEVLRIKQAYHYYSQSSAVQRKRNPSNPGNAAILRERERHLRLILARHGLLPLGTRKVLDVGCGAGGVLASLVDFGAQPQNLWGVDLLPERIEAARANHPHIHWACCNAENLDFADGSFDLVLLFTVFSSILHDQMAVNVATEVDRVLKPGGAIVWYDFRYGNPENPHVRGIPKRFIRRYFRAYSMHLEPITLVPPMARLLGKLTPILYPVLSMLPFLRTHYIGVLIRP